MVTSIMANRPVNATAQLVAPSAARTAPLSLDDLHFQDKLAFTSNVRTTDQEAIDALNHLAANIGPLRKTGFFSNPKIDINEALQRLKNGDKIMIENSKVKGVKDYIKNLDQLMLADDLIGRKQDHGVARPELRLPLLFLEGKKLEPYNQNDNDTGPRLLDAYTAYEDLDNDWRIVVDNKAVKPKDLASHVIGLGLTASKDPGLTTLAQFRKLAADGWTVNGRGVSRDVAYMAYITGNTRVTFQSAAIESAKDFSLLLNLVANDPNNAIDADLRSRLTNLRLGGFSAPGITNFYTVYKHLANGQALSYQGNLLNNLNDVIIFDALNGSQKSTSLLPSDLHQALLYLGQDQGLNNDNLYKTWQLLAKGESVSYAFNGGPTGETIRLHANSHSSLVTLKDQVVAQRQRDQFRPEFGDAKQILQDRLPGFAQPLEQNLQRSQSAAERARQDLPVQQGKLEQAERDYQIIKPVHDSAYADYQQAENTARQAERRYQNDKRTYDMEKDQYDRIHRDYNYAQREYQRATDNARQAESRARQEDGLVNSDPQNAESHRQKAAQHRSQAASYQAEANRHYNTMQRLNSDLERARWDVDRAERAMSQSRNIYWDAKQNADGKKTQWQYQQSLLNDASNRANQARNQISLANQTIADTNAVERLTHQAQSALSQLQSAVGKLKNYGDYDAQRALIQSQAAALQASFSDPTYTRIHGGSLQTGLSPLQTLLANMDKPAQK